MNIASKKVSTEPNDEGLMSPPTIDESGVAAAIG
jgi:hypothetical protein